MAKFQFAETFPDALILCVGDVMLDHFYSGETLRISPEAPVPVLKIQDCDTMPGGAANTAMNMGSLGAAVRLLAPVGDDPSGQELRKAICSRFDIQLDGPPDLRGTITKTRYSSQGQQLLRIDQEDASPISVQDTQALLAMARGLVDQSQLLVLSDYGKGVLGTELCQELIAIAREKGIPCVVDPKGNDFSKYSGATLITPNELELSVVSGRRPQSEEDVIEDSVTLIRSHQFDYVAVTRGKNGVMLVGRDGLIRHVPSFARDVFDVSGAGDSFVAGLSCAIAVGESMDTAVQYGNAVAGVAVGKSGTATVTCEEVEALIEVRGRLDQAPITSDYAILGETVKAWQAAGLKVGLTNGVFDLLHLGHLRILKESSVACDKLVVAINSDASVKRYKGDTRPIQPQDVRAELLSNIQHVDIVVIFEEDTPIDVIRMSVPDLLVKGGDYIAEEVVGYHEVTEAGGQVMIVPTLHGYSTTATVQKMHTAG